MSKKSLNIIQAEQDETALTGNAGGEFTIGENGITRRKFLQVLGAASAAGVVGCADSAKQKIYPYAKGEETQIPGVAVWYSSTCTECGAGCGIRVRTREGRAVKVEGNPESPINQGGLCALGQSSLQNLYDPDRVREPLKRDGDKLVPITWAEAATVLSDSFKGKGKQAIITGEVSGALAELLASYEKNFSAQHLVYETFDPVDLAQAGKLVFGTYGVPEYDFGKAEAIVSFGADFLETWISPCSYARGWAQGRRRAKPVRVVHIEPRLSLTGANADTWLVSEPGSELDIAMAVLKGLVQQGKGSSLDSATIAGIKKLVANASVEEAANRSGVKIDKILLITQYLAEAEASLVLPGGAAATGSSGLALAVVTNLINLVLGNVGTTIQLGALRTPRTSIPDIKKLVETLESENDFGLVCFYGADPLFSLPTASRLKYAVKRARRVISFSSHLDDTSQIADYIFPTHTSLESWGDAEAVTGVRSLIQPSMSPVFNTRHIGDLLIEASNAAGKDIAGGSKDFQTYLKKSWEKVYAKASKKPADFESFWLQALERGGYWEDYKPATKVAVKVDPQAFAVATVAPVIASSAGAKAPVLYTYPSVRSFDGRAANRPWMHELPDPITRLVWGNWVEIHPKTALKYELAHGDIVRLSTETGEINAPAYVTEYVSENIVAVPIGEGHAAYGRYAQQVSGGNVLSLIPDQLKLAASSLQLLATRVQVKKGRGREKLIQTQGSDSQMGRELARTRYVEPVSDHEHAEHGHAEHGHGAHAKVEDFYEQRVHPLYRWGLAVDLAACTGCAACVVACYAENNIHVVGPKDCDEGREMSWLRIERYYEGPAEELNVSFLPMMCQHCGNAPCEPVCPVYATYHNEEGLNAMIYNRCVGTRYCGNNCSYKVRRFNWSEYDAPEPLNWQLNPDVTKRTAGVMEKCTFCVQRIIEGKDRAKDEGRLVADGEIKPACVQSCATEAMVFGDLNDPRSKVSKLSKNQRAYKVLDHHLNTQPAISYLDNVKYKI